MRQTSLLLICFCLAILSVRAQFVFVPGQTIDFGQVEEWRNNPADFYLVNTGQKPLAILKLVGSGNIVAQYPKTYINPGDTGKISISFYTPHTGAFSETVEVMLSASFEPVKLSIKGKIKNLASDALTACPGDNMQGTPPSFSQKFIALDAITGKVIPGTEFYVGTQGEWLDRFKIPAGGKPVNKTYKSGLYALKIRAEGYLPLDTGIVILAGNRSYTFYLNKTIEPVLVGITPVPVPEPEPVPPVVNPVPPPKVIPPPVGPDTSIIYPDFPITEFKPNNIVFILDVSSSMRLLGRLDMLKEAMLRLVTVLRPVDRVSIITFTTSPVTRIQGAYGNQHDTLSSIIRSFTAAGATNGIKGLKYAYELAENHFIEGGNNMVIIGTDGVFAQTDENGVNILTLVESYVAKQIKLGVMAFGRDAEALKSMEKVAAKGNGGYMRMDEPARAAELLLEQIRLQSRRAGGH